MDTIITSLAQLNKLLKPQAQGWTLVRSRSGYYYWQHPEHAPSSGVYVYSCKGMTLSWWTRELSEHLARI